MAPTIRLMGVTHRGHMPDEPETDVTQETASESSTEETQETEQATEGEPEQLETTEQAEEDPEDDETPPEGLSEKAQARFQKLANERREAREAQAARDAYAESIGVVWDGSKYVDKPGATSPEPTAPPPEEVKAREAADRAWYEKDFDPDDPYADDSIATDPKWQEEARRQGLDPAKLGYDGWALAKQRRKADETAFNAANAEAYVKAKNWFETDADIVADVELAKAIDAGAMAALQGGATYAQLATPDPKTGESTLDRLKYEAIGRREVQKRKTSAETATRERAAAGTQGGGTPPAGGRLKPVIPAEVREHVERSGQDPAAILAKLKEMRGEK